MKLSVRGNKSSRKSADFFSFRLGPEPEQGSFDLEREVPANVWKNLDLQLKHIKEDKDQPGYVGQLIELAGVLAPVRPSIREQFRSNSDNIAKLLQIAKAKILSGQVQGRLKPSTQAHFAHYLQLAPEVRSMIQDVISDKLDDMLSETTEYWLSMPLHPQLFVEMRHLVQLFPEQREKILRQVQKIYPNFQVFEQFIDQGIQDNDWTRVLVTAAEQILLFPERAEKIKLKIAPHWPAIKLLLAQERSLYVKREFIFSASIISAPEVSITAQGLIQVKRRQVLPPTVSLPERPHV